MAGNAGVLKHASNVSGCALAIQDIFDAAGFPQHVFTSLLVESSRVERIIRHPVIKAVTLTGSTPAGRALSWFGIQEFVNFKTIYHAAGRQDQDRKRNGAADSGAQERAAGEQLPRRPDGIGYFAMQEADEYPLAGSYIYS